jgi:signal transduction histidine kinase
VLIPTAVYNHADAWEHPWKWASIHGLFVVGASVAGLMNWRLEEAARGAVARAQADATRQQAAREQAEASIRARDQFLSIASHELLTPITSLKLYLQLLKRPGRAGDPNGPVDTFGGYELVERQTQKLHRLVSQLLDVTRIESGHLRLDRDSTDLATVVEDVVTSARARDDRRAIRVHSPSQLFIQADALRLEQVLTNLVDNALKYSPSDSPVDVELEEGPTGSVRIVVADRGPGVPASLRKSIFDRFYRAEETIGAHGVGLGLFVSRQIVLLHGGRIEVQERPGGGSRFVVTLPTGLGEQPDASLPANTGVGFALMT